MRHALPLALALLATTQASSAERPYYRNVAPSLGNVGGPTGGTVDETVKEEPPAEDPADKVGPLRLTATPSGTVPFTYKASTRLVFHSAGECQTRNYSVSGVPESTPLSSFGLTEGKQGNDYVISGRLNVVGGGGFNVAVTVAGCGQRASTSAFVSFNPGDPEVDAPWELRLDGTSAFSGRTFAFYPEIRKLGTSYGVVDTSGFTYELNTLDPVNRPVPAWLTMPDVRTGILRGQAPTQAGTYGPYYVTAKAPNGGYSESVDVNVKVDPAFVFNGPASVELKAGEETTVTFTGSGGCGDINSSFGVDSSTSLPTGMSRVYAEDRWIVSGTPTVGGTWPVRLVYSDYMCGGAQFFPVTFTVTGAPEKPFAFTNKPGDVAAVIGGNWYEQATQGYLDFTGPAWGTTTCELVNADSSPANLPWAKNYPMSENYRCVFAFEPTQASQYGTYSLRLKATTDTGRSAESEAFTVTVGPAAATSPTP